MEMSPQTHKNASVQDGKLSQEQKWLLLCNTRGRGYLGCNPCARRGQLGADASRGRLSLRVSKLM